MTMTRVPPRLCPHCGSLIEAATDAYGDERPSPGDASMCIDCGGFVIFSDDLTVRLPTDAEKVALDNDPRVKHMRLTRECLQAVKGLVGKRKFLGRA